MRVVLAVFALVTSSVGATPPNDALDGSLVHRGIFLASDGAVIEYFTHGKPSSGAVLISPAFTGDAKVYAEKFGDALPDNFVVSVQLRGHGGSGGCSFGGSKQCSPHQGPNQGKFLDVSMERLAGDLREAKLHLGLRKMGFIGHSLGWNVICEYMRRYGLDDVVALFAYDQSPKNLAGGDDLDSDFPKGIATYPRSKAWEFSKQMGVFSNGSYPKVAESIRALLGGVAGGAPVFNPQTQDPAFLLTTNAWDEWARFANQINGHVLSRMFWSSITSDYTDIYPKVRAAGVPMLVYGGKSSVVPWQAMKWVHQQVPGSEFMLFGSSNGVHGAFLNPGPSGARFMAGVRSFFMKNRPTSDHNVDDVQAQASPGKRGNDQPRSNQ